MWSQRSLETVPCFNIYYKRTTVRSETNSLVVKPKTIAQPPMALKWTDITWTSGRQ
uniref:Niemann-Pick C1 protein-like n=1 Tax=Rhizophora mucronata TaxID=61149 RepID=A0A2P2JRM8_RHIMU